MLDLRGVSVMAVMGGILVLTGCEDSSGSHAGSGAPSSSPSVNASVSAGASSHVPADTTPSASAGTTPTPSRTSVAPAGATTSPTPAGTAASADRSGCHNLTATNAVKAAVTAAYQRSFPRFAHIQPVPGQFFYGQCGGVRYAATRFESTPGATYEQLVSMQDEGGATKYFRSTSAGNWSYVASDGFPRGPQGCGDVPQIPEALAAVWRNCSVM